MTYEFALLKATRLLRALTRAGEALARLDERVSRSPIREGFLQRQNFHDAVSSLWVDGELVHVEDLVLHDARMDIRAPTNEIVNAHRILRARRLMESHPPQWALSDHGIDLLRGKNVQSQSAPLKLMSDEQDADLEEPDDAQDTLADELAEMDAVLSRSSAIVADALSYRVQSEPSTDRLALDQSDEESEEERLHKWRKLLDRYSDYPAPLQAAILLDAWRDIQVSDRSPWLGRQLAAASLRSNGLTILPALNSGLRAIHRERRHCHDQEERLIAILDGMSEAAELGMKEHDRLLNGKSRMERRLIGKRSNSRLPDLVELVLANPVVSTSMIVKELGTTPQGAMVLANQLELREVTGRGRFRAWGIL
ncbi:hypothetical protein QE369_001384 [Agrobacterium larrymoorei]|uniref:DUF1612 domain-containing protein n=1 Tax=Agrobacterium larrymoorei TaxID=160699 RepID=A0AAJ2B859_9HYPH|nr:RHE_PE00001 family protein [Agrobacterium larrymoorei]MDR6101206.1 hypothetical protein [Agrobacterium larrymoorei]